MEVDAEEVPADNAVMIETRSFDVEGPCPAVNKSIL